MQGHAFYHQVDLPTRAAVHPVLHRANPVRHADTEGMGAACDRQAQGIWSLRDDGTRVAGRLGAGANSVVVSAAISRSNQGYLGEDIEQCSQHFVVCADHVRTGFGQQERLIQVQQGAGHILTSGVGNLRPRAHAPTRPRARARSICARSAAICANACRARRSSGPGVPGPFTHRSQFRRQQQGELTVLIMLKDTLRKSSSPRSPSLCEFYPFQGRRRR